VCRVCVYSRNGSGSAEKWTSVSPWSEALSVLVDEWMELVRSGGFERQPKQMDLILSHLGQGLTLVNFPAQLERFAWDRGCIKVLIGVVQGVVRGD